VEWQYQRDEAEYDILKLGGVKMIINDIVVAPTLRPADVQSRIREALERSADLDASRIEVTVEDGKIILHGKVSAWIERETAERAAWSAPGVTAVDDRITIERP
jgi:osmotically-inducible protein OsmY